MAPQRVNAPQRDDDTDNEGDDDYDRLSLRAEGGGS